MKFQYTCPDNDYKKIPFSDNFIRKLVTYYNLTVLKNERISTKTNAVTMYRHLNLKMKKYNVYKKYWIWPRLIEKLVSRKYSGEKDRSKFEKIQRVLRYFENKEFMPEKPASWYKQPNKWLSNYDIANVMRKYEECKRYKYRFLGVFPIDFSVLSENGNCLYSSFCKIDINKLLKKYSFVGLITNLDKHDQPGSHWTSTFFVIDPKLPTYGAYYYDSVGKGIPVYLLSFFRSIKEACDKLNPNKKFIIHINKKQHQRKNTECGMFSMIFQIRWLNKHIVKKNKTSLQEIVANPHIDDENMLILRDHLYRPNLSEEKLI